jgi:hypothetical protein
MGVPAQFRLQKPCRIVDKALQFRLTVSTPQESNYETFVNVSHSTPTALLSKSLLFVAILGVFCCWAGRVDASCGDYLEHRSMGKSHSPFGDKELPASPFSPGCRGGQCNKVPPVAPFEPVGPRVVVRQILGTPDLALPTFELIQLSWSVSDCNCPPSIGLQVLLRPPIA